MTGLSLRDLAFLSALQQTNAQTTQWLADIATNGGAVPSANTINAANYFGNRCDVDGLTPLIVVANFMAPDSLTACLTPYIHFGVNDAPHTWWINQGPFVIGDLSVNGLKGDGVGKALHMADIHTSPKISKNNLSLIIYSFDAATGAEAGSNGTMIGNAETSGSAGATITGQMRFGFDKTVPYGNYCNLVSDGGKLQVGNTPLWLTGYLCASKTASNVRNIYQAKSTLAHASVASNAVVDTVGTDIPDLETYVFAGHEGTFGASNFSSQRLSFVCIAAGLSAAQSLAMFNAIQGTRVLLGGGFL